MLRALSKDRTLIVILDDLHWADSASLNLLFHLSRALMDCRVLIIGTYRPDDVALGRGDERHPLEPILNELKRYGGDIVIDLSEARTHEGRAFVDALIDAEPNQLNEAFRAELFTRTGGHPLFTVEMLRNLKERGDLVAKFAYANWGRQDGATRQMAENAVALGGRIRVQPRFGWHGGKLAVVGDPMGALLGLLER